LSAPTYRVRFEGRPDLGLDSYEASHALSVGDVLHDVREGIDEPTLAWGVTAVVPGRQSQPDTLVVDLMPWRVVTISAAGGRHARKRGGRIYVWAKGGSALGVLRASTADPGIEEQLERRRVAGVDVFLAESAALPEIRVCLALTRRKLIARDRRDFIPVGW
jgi:hypothetical protein